MSQKFPQWLRISLLLSIFGFLKEIRPSEPFVYEFLIDTRWRNISATDVVTMVYPMGTYSYLANLVVVFLITDLLRYKPLIVILGASGIVIWSMLLWTESLMELQILEFFYGTFCASEVAYYTYIYAKVDTEHFQLVTSHTRAAILAGSTMSGLLSQLLVSFHVMNYRQLNYITFSAMIAASLWTLFLPPVENSIYFHRAGSDKQSFWEKVKDAFRLMTNHFQNSFFNIYILKWSLWYALSTCGFVQVQTYIQPLWTEINKNTGLPIYNGAVHSIVTVIGFFGALLAGVMKADWRIKGDLALTLCSLLQGFILLFCSRTDYVMSSYICYIANGALFYFMITITSSEIAKYIRDESYGLVFGINTFVALVCQTLMTAVVVTEGVGFALGPKDQYFVYGCYHLVIAVTYIVIGLVAWVHRSKEYRKNSIVGMG